MAKFYRILAFVLCVIVGGVLVRMVPAYSEAMPDDDRPTHTHHHGAAKHMENAENPSPEAYRHLPTTTLNARTTVSTSPYAKSSSVVGPRFDRQVHLFDLPDSSRFLSCAGSGNDTVRNREGRFSCEVYNWATGARKSLTLPTDWFCGAGVFRSDGNLLFSGGTANFGYPDDNAGNWAGDASTYLFNTKTLAITKLGDMNEPRWYNNTFRNWFDESIYTFGGLHLGAFSSSWEVMKQGSTTWDKTHWLHENYSYDDYKVLDSNHVAYTGATSTNSSLPPHILDLRDGSTIETPGIRDVGLRNASAGLMLYPAQAKRVGVFGGGSYLEDVQAINKLDLINYGVWPAKTPSFTAGPSMPASVMFVLATNLPNGQVLVTGGTREWRTGSVLWSAIYTPWTNRWTRLAPSRVARNYHSNILTLSDGRVMTFSGNPGNGSFEPRSEIFTLWYSYRPRPLIRKHTKYMRFGRSYVADVRFPTGARVGKVTLDSPRSTTHSSSDTNYGLFSVKSTVVGRDGQMRRIRLSIPANNSIPPGWYKLSFVTGGDVTKKGVSGQVPSKSVWVKISR